MPTERAVNTKISTQNSKPPNLEGGNDAPGRSRGRVLIADDDPQVLRAYAAVLSASGYSVETALDGREASDRLKAELFDVIVSDIDMPEMDGLQLLRTVRECDPDVPVILVTGGPTVETAAQAVEFGALRYLLKPVASDILRKVVEQAVRLHKLAKLKRQALAHLDTPGLQMVDRAGLELSFERALSSLWMAYQPIVSVSRKQIFGYEALLRTSEPALPHPGAVLSTAERLGRLDDLGRAIRARVAATLSEAPKVGNMFVNLHTRDLLDETLYSPDAPFSGFAKRVVLEITERATLDQVPNVRSRVAALRKMGFRIAIDDLGAGYAGLTSFALLEPQLVKLDMSLVRNVCEEPTKRMLIRSMAELCREMGLLVIAEGVETVEERDTLSEIGCDLLQGYLFAKPGTAFPEVTW